jgi:membrane-associated phospholipid phosphatase
MSEKIARVISNVLNPYIICFVTVVFVVAHTSNSFLNALKWSAIALVFSLFPVFSFILVQVQRKKLKTIFPEGQNQRKVIYALASSFSAVGYVIMLGFNAPHLLVVSFLSGMITVIVFMLINLYWKISLHTAFISAAAVVLLILYGGRAVWLFTLLPVIGWSRLKLKQHTLAQVIAGAVLSAGIISGMYWGLGVI